jgi:serine/threonine-protein kinase
MRDQLESPQFQHDDVLDNTYRIVDSIAAGGMGKVYRAVHLRIPREIAIKTLQPEFAARPDCVLRFTREACSMARLHHPNIVQVLDFNVASGGVPYIAMELIDGDDLRTVMNSGHRFTAAEVVSMVRQIASALDAAHAAGVVHRDLKPENVLLTPAPGQLPVVRVIDFGLSLCGWASRVTGEHSVFGTPDYMAPEQAQGLRDRIEPRTDQFALASLAYTLLAGQAPFSRPTAVEVLYAIVNERPAPLPAMDGWNAAPVEKVLHRGLARQLEDRFPSVIAFVEAFEDALVKGGALPAATLTPLPVRVAVQAPPPAAPARPAAARRLAPARRRTALRRSMPAVVMSLAVGIAVWGNLIDLRMPWAQGAWRENVEAVRATVTTEWNRLLGSRGQAADDIPVLEAQP